MRLFFICFLFFGAGHAHDLCAQVDRIELGYQTTRRGIVWYRPGLPDWNPTWKFSRDTNAVLWVDTLTAIRYDWDYTDDRWRAKGTFSGATPPLPQQTNGTTTIDNRTAFWVRDTFNLLHKYDSAANAWTPWGDWFYLSSVPTNIALTGSHGAAKYTRSLWQNSSTNEVRYWDGDSWEPFGSTADGSETIVTSGTGISVSGTGTSGDPYIVTNTAPDQTVSITNGGGVAVTGTYPSFTLTATDQAINNEGVLGVSAGGANDALLTSNTSGANGVTINGGTGITISESTSSNGGSITINSTATGTVTGAENGTNIVSNKVRLGGNLITAATSIEGDGNELRFFDGKFSLSSWTGFANTPVQFLRMQSTESLPTTNASPTEDGIIEFRLHSSAGSDQSNSLTIGGYPTDADGMWMQARSASNPSFEYPLSLQPRGGLFSIGRTGGLDALATIHGAGLAGSDVAGSVLHLENSEGNGKVAMSMGAGTDAMDSEVAWFDATDALRITNRSSANNTSSIRMAIGGETNDLAALVKSSNGTSLAKFGVGVGNPSNIHSTIQSAGGYAGRVLTTVGSFTLDESNWVVAYTSSGTVTWTLPSASTCQGREYILCSRGTGTVNLSVSVSKGNGGTFNSLSAGQWAHIWSDGSGWTGYKLSSL